MRQPDRAPDFLVEHRAPRFLIPERLKHREVVAREQRRGIGGQVRGRVREADDCDAMLDHGLIGNRALDIAPLRGRQIEDHAARLHCGDLRVGDQHRGGAPRDQRGGDDDVLLGDVFGDELRLRGLVFLAHLGGIAARALALDPCDILDEDRLGAQ